MGCPEADALSDGDSDDSDDEASGSSGHLTRRVLESSAEWRTARQTMNSLTPQLHSNHLQNAYVPVSGKKQL